MLGLASAATKTWTGAVDSDWATAGNWAGGVPAAADDVVINGGNITSAASISGFASVTFGGTTTLTASANTDLGNVAVTSGVVTIIMVATYVFLKMIRLFRCALWSRLG